MSKENIITQVVSESLKKAQLNKIYEDLFDLIGDVWGLNHNKLYLKEEEFGLDKKSKASTFDFTVNNWDFTGSEKNKIIIASPTDIDVTIRLFLDWFYIEKYITEQDITKEEIYEQLKAQLPKLTNEFKTKTKQIELDGSIYDDNMAYPMTEDNDKVLPSGIYFVKSIDSVKLAKDYIEIKLSMGATTKPSSFSVPKIKQDISDWNLDIPD